MSQFSGFPQAAVDYNSTIIGALELSEKKWVRFATVASSSPELEKLPLLGHSLRAQLQALRAMRREPKSNLSQHLYSIRTIR